MEEDSRFRGNDGVCDRAERLGAICSIILRVPGPDIVSKDGGRHCAFPPYEFYDFFRGNDGVG